MKIKVKHITGIIYLIILFMALFYSKQIAKSVECGIKISLDTLIPSLFIFLILSDFFQKTGALKAILKPFSFVCSKLFKLDISLGQILLFSLICGYPAGSILISNMVLSNKISKQTANRMLYFCVNSGPAFLISGVSVPLFGNILPGIILFIAQIVSFFTVGFLSSIGKSTEKAQINSTEMPIVKAMVLSVQNTIKSMAMICGLTILFSTIIGILIHLNIFNIKSNNYLKALFFGLIEVTNGVSFCKNINGMNMFLILTIITSFGGICVHCQLKYILERADIRFGAFYKWRIVYCAISILVSYVLFSYIKIPVSTFAENIMENNISTHNPTSSIILIILSIALLYCDKKTVIIKNKYKRIK